MPVDENAVVTPETIDIYSEFAVTLKRIHTRLIAEGYMIKDGEITKSERLVVIRERQCAAEEAFTRREEELND